MTPTLRLVAQHSWQHFLIKMGGHVGRHPALMCSAFLFRPGGVPAGTRTASGPLACLLTGAGPVGPPSDWYTAVAAVLIREDDGGWKFALNGARTIAAVSVRNRLLFYSFNDGSVLNEMPTCGPGQTRDNLVLDLCFAGNGILWLVRTNSGGHVVLEAIDPARADTIAGCVLATNVEIGARVTATCRPEVMQLVVQAPMQSYVRWCQLEGGVVSLNRLPGTLDGSGSATLLTDLRVCAWRQRELRLLAPTEQATLPFERDVRTVTELSRDTVLVVLRDGTACYVHLADRRVAPAEFVPGDTAGLCWVSPRHLCTVFAHRERGKLWFDIWETQAAEPFVVEQAPLRDAGFQPAPPPQLV